MLNIFLCQHLLTMQKAEISTSKIKLPTKNKETQQILTPLRYFMNSENWDNGWSNGDSEQQNRSSR